MSYVAKNIPDDILETLDRTWSDLTSGMIAVDGSFTQVLTSARSDNKILVDPFLSYNARVANGLVTKTVDLTFILVLKEKRN